MISFDTSATIADAAQAQPECAVFATGTCDYLIIGNSAAGVTAAEHIRAADVSGSILIVSREPYAVYGRPLISYLLEGKTDEDHIGFKPAGFYDEIGAALLAGPAFEVTTLDASSHTVALASGDIVTYGQCLVATGSVPFTPPIEGLDVEGLSNASTFITLDDAKAALEQTKTATLAAHDAGNASRVLVIGAGLIGLKAAEALSHHADEVRVLELAPRILPAVLDEQGAAMLQDALETHHIFCTPGISASRILVEDGRAVGAELTDGSTVEVDVVVAAVGVRPASAIAVEAGAEQGRGLICDEQLHTSLPDMFAAGDVTQVTDLLDGAQRPLALWPNALRQGKIAGAQMAAARTGTPATDAEGNPDVFVGNFAVNAVDFFDQSLLTAGIINPTEDSGCETHVICDDEANTYAKFVTREGCLVGYILLNRPEHAGIYTALIEQRTPLDTLEDDIFAAPPENLDFPCNARWERLHKCYPSSRDMRGWENGAPAQGDEAGTGSINDADGWKE